MYCELIQEISSTDSFRDWRIHLSGNHALPYFKSRRSRNDDGC